MEEEEPTGYVTFEKFEKVVLELIQDSTLSRDDEERIYRAFKTLDPDNKGFLRPEELKECLTLNGEKFTEEEFEEMLANCVDPQEGKIYYEGKTHSLNVIFIFFRLCQDSSPIIYFYLFQNRCRTLA